MQCSHVAAERDQIRDPQVWIFETVKTLQLVKGELPIFTPGEPPFLTPREPLLLIPGEPLLLTPRRATRVYPRRATPPYPRRANPTAAAANLGNF